MKKLSEMSLIAQLGIAIACSAALFAAGEFAYLKAIATENNELKGRVDAMRAENEKLKPFEADFKKLLAEHERLQSQLANLRNIVPEEKEVDGFIRMIQEAGVQSGVNVRRFVARPVSAKEFYMEMPFELNVDGNYYTVLQFFDRLSKLSRIINVSNLYMGPTAKGARGVARRYAYTPNETIVASCTATTFFSREAAAAGAAAKK